MNAKELRIGNYVFDDDEDVVMIVSSVSDKEFTNWNTGDEYNIVCLKENTSGLYSDGNFRPIPLTEEWLLKLGFEYEFDDDRFVFDTNIPSGLSMIYFIKNGIIFYFNNDIKEWIEIPIIIKYVHQLQNLYFALTGEELTYV